MSLITGDESLITTPESLINPIRARGIGFLLNFCIILLTIDHVADNPRHPRHIHLKVTNKLRFPPRVPL